MNMDQHVVAALGVGLTVFVLLFILGTSAKAAVLVRGLARMGLAAGGLGCVAFAAAFVWTAGSASDYLRDPTCEFAKPHPMRGGNCRIETARVLGTSMRFQRTSRDGRPRPFTAPPLLYDVSVALRRERRTIRLAAVLPTRVFSRAAAGRDRFATVLLDRGTIVAIRDAAGSADTFDHPVERHRDAACLALGCLVFAAACAAYLRLAVKANGVERRRAPRVASRA